MLGDEGGIHDGALDQLVIELVDELAGAPLLLELGDAVVAAELAQLFDREVEAHGPADLLGDELAHGAGAEVAAQVDGVPLVLDGGGAVGG